MRIPDHLRNQLVKTVDEHELDCIDFSHFLAAGASHQIINLVINAVNQLKQKPYLTEKELIREGFTEKQLRIILGGVDNLKKLLNIENYSFQDWLTMSNCIEGDDICIPYEVYQCFYPDIADKHIQLLRLKDWLKVEVNGIQMHEFVLPSQAKALIPATDKQAAELLVDIWTDRNELVAYDEEHSILIFLHIESGNKFPIEVRSRSSDFTSLLRFGFCIEDDQKNTRFLKVDKTITAYELIEKINEVDRKAAENF